MVYVDTSVIVALLTVEPKTHEVTTWFSGLHGTPVCADWLLTEFHSAISIKLRSGQVTEAAAKQVRKEFETLADGGLHLVPVSRAAFRDAATMARQHAHGLRAGDSLHLAVALELGASHMATLDETLAMNAKRHGMTRVDL